jgi:hypothetical protein
MDEWSAPRTGRFTSRERAPGTRWIGGLVDSRAVLDAVVKGKISSPRQESKPRTPIVQSLSKIKFPEIIEQNKHISYIDVRI